MKRPRLNTFLLLVLVFFCCRQDESKKFSYAETCPFIKEIVGDKWIYFEEGKVTVEELCTTYKKALGINIEDSLVVTDTRISDATETRYTIQQKVNGVKIEDGTAFFHTKNGFVSRVKHNLVRHSKIMNQALLKPYQLFPILQKEFPGFEKSELSDKSVELIFFRNNSGIQDPKIFYCWKQLVIQAKPADSYMVFVDAENGKIIKKQSLSQTCASGTGNTAYHGSKTIHTQLFNSIQGYRLYDDCKHDNYTATIHTIEDEPNKDYFDADNKWTSSGDIPGVQTHWATHMVLDYFGSYWGRNSFDGKGGAVVCQNTFVPGKTQFDGGTNQIYLCNNNLTNNYDNDNSVDIIGHEFTHGVTKYEAGLRYEKESGALNESFSDIFGIAIKRWVTGADNWELGKETGKVYRSLSNPASYGQPTAMLDKYWKNVGGCSPVESNDNCFVHTNSGVQNYWFYLLVNGGSADNSLGKKYSVDKIGFADAIAITYRNLTNELSSSDGYADARQGSIDAATYLFGASSKQVCSVRQAWYAVGVGADCSSTSTAQKPGSFTLTVTPECKGTTTQNRLDWTASKDAAAYDIYRNGILYSSGITGTQFLNTSVTAGTNYSYTVQAKNTAGTTTNSNGSQSGTAPVCTTTPSSGSFTLALSPECNGTQSQVRLNWTVSANATAYDVYRDGILYAGGVTGLQYINTNVTTGTSYSYSVQAKSSGGNINNSNGILSANAPNCSGPAKPGSFDLTLVPECNGTNSLVRLTWTSSANATSYDVYRNGVLLNGGITGNQFDNTIVTAGTSYFYYVTAKNSAGSVNNANGVLSATAKDCLAPPPPAAPGSFTLSVSPECNGTNSQIRLNWTSAPNATTYDIYRNGAVYSANLTGTQYINTGITAGTSYSYAVQAKNNTGVTSNTNGPLSAAAPTCTSVALPSAFTLTGTAECNGSTSQVKLEWTASANAASYDVYRNGSLYASAVTSTQYVNSNVTEGTQYNYYVTAKNSGGSFSNSNGAISITAIACSIPVPGTFNLTLTPECNGTNNQIRLNWTAAPGAVSYDVYRNGTLIASAITGTQYINTGGMAPNTDYSYYVEARNQGGAIRNSNGSVDVKAPDCSVSTPGAFTLSSVKACDGTTSIIELNWTASANATSYDVYKNNSLYAVGVTGTKFVNSTDLLSGTTYTYSVIARNSVGSINNSNGTLSIVAPNCSPLSAGDFTLTASAECLGSTGQISLNWTQSSGALSYDVYRNGLLYSANVAGRQFINSFDLVAGVSYSYYVVAKGQNGNKTNSNGIQQASTPVCAGPPPGSFTLTVTPGCNGITSQIKLEWTASANAKSYDVYRDGFLYAVGLAGREFVNTSINVGRTYNYYVKANNPGGSTDNSNGIIEATAPDCAEPTPGSFTLSAIPECIGTNSQIRLNWTASANATSYDLYRNGFLYGSGITANQFTNTNIVPGVSYSYMVQANNSSGHVYNANGSLGVTARDCSLLLPGVFTLTLVAECNGAASQMRLNWTISNNASTYDVYCNGLLLARDLTTNQFITTSVTPIASYSYYVVARNLLGNTMNANGILSVNALDCAVPLPGSFTANIISECNGTTGQIKLTWTASQGASFYDIYRDGILFATGVTGLQYVTSNLTPGSVYGFYVKARNASGGTNNSNGILLGTALDCFLPAAGTFTLTAVPECINGVSQIRLDWTTSANATSYDLYRNGTLYSGGLTGNQFINSNVSAGNTYTYYVQAKNFSSSTSNSNGTLSRVALNCALPVVGAFTLTVTPECVSGASQIRLNWTSSANATSYDLYRNGVLYASGITGNLFINGSVTADNTYTYQVQARNNLSNVNNSNGTLSAKALNCSVTAIIDPANNPFDLKISPNPSAGRFILSLKGAINKVIPIQVLNGSGQVIYSQKLKVNANLFTHEINIHSQAAGVYYITIGIDKNTYLRKLIKQ